MIGAGIYINGRSASAHLSVRAQWRFSVRPMEFVTKAFLVDVGPFTLSVRLPGSVFTN